MTSLSCCKDLFTISRFLKTKFFIPSWRAGSVSRPRLLERLDAGLSEGHKLTLVSAPACYGKTTLAVEWIQSLENHGYTTRVTWLSLDEGDNDPVRFLSYLVWALQSVEKTLSI